MQRLTHIICVLAVMLLLTASARAFSLMGPFASWQTGAIGYNLPGDVGGPMNIFEGYRITVPVLTYG